MTTICLVTYDIANPRRLRRMHRALRKIAAPIQYSVFLGRFTRAELSSLRALIHDIIDPEEDDVRIYPLPADGWQRRIGKPNLPEGVLFTMLPREFRHLAGPTQPATPPPNTKPAPIRGAAVRAEVRRARTGQQRGLFLIR